jgi:hypothetical protein
MTISIPRTYDRLFREVSGKPLIMRISYAVCETVHPRKGAILMSRGGGTDQVAAGCMNRGRTGTAQR